MNILIVEDDAGLTELVKEKIELFGFQTASIQSAGKAIDWLKVNTPYLMILDYRLPDMNGKEFIMELQKTELVIPPFIVSTGQGDEHIAVEMMKLGARDYLVKNRYFLDKLPEVLKRITDEIENENKRKQTEEKLLESESKYRELIELAVDGILMCSHEGIIISANSYMQKLTGRTLDNLIGLHINTLFSGEVLNKEPYRFDLHLEGNIVLIERNILCSNGKIITIEMHTKMMPNGTYQSIIRDITGRKMAEDNLRKLSSAVEQSQVSIVITNKDGVIEYVNPKLLEVTGFAVDETIGQNPRIFKSGEFSGNDYKDMWNILITGKEWKGIFHNRKKNGELFWESATISPVKNEFGEITHFVAVKEDITKKKEMEINLQKALEKAEEMSRLKSNFLANMNHELRTPLNGILGFAGILKEELKDQEHIKMASVILSSGRRLSETLNLILDLSDVEAEKIDISSKKLEVVSIVKNIAGLFTEAALQKKLDYRFINKERKIFAKLDEQFFPRVIYNLIDNSVKYTDKGSIVIEIGTENQNNNSLFYVKIKDTGIGISKENIEIIWNAFRQISEGLNRGYEGTGLGLTISKRITELLHGTIEVESELGKGSEFIVKFPAILEIVEEPEPMMQKEFVSVESGTTDHPSKELPRVLYVEDDITNQNVVKLYLKNRYLIDIADDAINALKLIEQKKYDIILMDINLGRGMNGIQVTKEIRKYSSYVNTPIIAVTAYTMGSDKSEFMRAGCTNYLAKPFYKNDLLKILDEISIRK